MASYLVSARGEAALTKLNNQMDKSRYGTIITLDAPAYGGALDYYKINW